jgi:hypothetical protein
MLDTFIDLVSVMSEDMTINEASFNSTSGFITIDGVSKEGKPFHLSCRYEETHP